MHPENRQASDNARRVCARKQRASISTRNRHIEIYNHHEISSYEVHEIGKQVYESRRLEVLTENFRFEKKLKTSPYKKFIQLD